MLSGNAFAADTTPRRVTQLEFDAAIATVNSKINDITQGHTFAGRLSWTKGFNKTAPESWAFVPDIEIAICIRPGMCCW